MTVAAVLVAALLIANRQESVLAGQTSVIDADTIRVAGRKARLQGPAAPYLGEWSGQAAKNDGTTSDDCFVGICYAAGQDVAAELVMGGLARDCPRFSKGRCRNLESAAAQSLSLPGYCTP